MWVGEVVVVMSVVRVLCVKAIFTVHVDSIIYVI